MRLSELEPQEEAVIVKVLGHGGFRKRILEMGFVRGRSVKMIQKAPLQDPIKYEIMSYEVSLRKSEANNIIVVSNSDSLEEQETDGFYGVSKEDVLRKKALTERKKIKIAFVGNPNCGKTTIFNSLSGLHEHVGNYSGVTVGAKTGNFKFQGYTFEIIDLPGTYSLSAYSPEEVFVRKSLIEEAPDIVINVMDGSNIERNLFLSTQLIDMNVRMIIALNMYDELRKKGDKFDYLQLSRLLGVPIVPTIARLDWGFITLFRVAIKVYEGTDFYNSRGEIKKEFFEEMHNLYHKSNVPHEALEEIREDIHSNIHGFFGKHGRFRHRKDFHKMNYNQTGVGSDSCGGGHKKNREGKDDNCLKNRIGKSGFIKMNDDLSKYNVGEMTRHVHINHGMVLEKAISMIREELLKDESLRDRQSVRFTAIKLLEGDKIIEKEISNMVNYEKVIAVRDKCRNRVKKYLKEDTESAVTNAKYGFIRGALKETYIPGNKKESITKWKIDKILLNKYLGYPVFLLFMFIMFQATFSLGQYPMDWIETGVTWLSGFVSNFLSAGILRDLIVDGIIGGIGGVIVFLPNIIILYFFISIMEDSGYMSRAAFIMDKLMHMIGLHGKSFIPLIMGFGCSVPAIMSTRTIENRNSRMITMLVTPFMSCSARLPVYLLLAGTFFPDYAGFAIFGMYVLGIIIGVMSAKLFRKFLFNSEELPFVMELSPYRFPTYKAIFRHVREKSEQYLKKMGTVILYASIIIWFLGYFPRNNKDEVAKVDKKEILSSKVSNVVEDKEKTVAFENIDSEPKDTYLVKIGQFIEPVLRPLGFNWKMDVALLCGVAAKEVVVSSMGVIYSSGDSSSNASLSQRLKNDKYSDGSFVFNTAVAVSFMVFVLLYFPCIATVSAIKSESGSWKWAVFEIIYSVSVAYVFAFVFYHIVLFLM